MFSPENFLSNYQQRCEIAIFTGCSNQKNYREKREINNNNNESTIPTTLSGVSQNFRHLFFIIPEIIGLIKKVYVGN